ncbi:hypothetical protein [Halococcus agarilyticus]|uniref:hypothetical protein n=1 Tax=Halococcus agarilyticus TaxID=1232219 RepID=UPI0012AB817A|nr:hypothetical protein [Halococcus agarilyticus]
MATTQEATTNRKIAANLPDKRTYEDAETAELDKALVEAIQRAEDANNDYLAHLLRNELESVYHGSKIDL